MTKKTSLLIVVLLESTESILVFCILRQTLFNPSLSALFHATHKKKHTQEMFYAPDDAMQCLLQPSVDDLIGLDRSIAELHQQDAAGSPAVPHHVFQYAAALISHRRKDYLAEGVRLLEGLVFQVWRRQEQQHEEASERAPPVTVAPSSAVQANTAPQAESDWQAMLPVYYYYIAVAWTKLEDYIKARSAVERMLLLEPANRQGLHLRDHLENVQTQEGLIGLMGATAALGAAIACFAILRRK